MYAFCIIILIILPFCAMFFSGSSYSDNLQPFDRSIPNAMSINKTEPKVCITSVYQSRVTNSAEEINTLNSLVSGHPRELKKVSVSGAVCLQ